MRLKKTTVLFAIAVALCTLMILVYFGSVYALRSLAMAVTDEQHHVSLMRATAEEQSMLAQQLEGVMADRDALKQYFITEEEVVEFLELVEALGRGEGAEVATAAITVVEENESVEQLHLTIKARGSRSAVQGVLSLLEMLPYKSAVVDAAVERVGTAGGGEEWEGTFKVIVAKHTSL